MIFELQWKFTFKGFSGGDNYSVGPFLQDPSIPVVGAHNPKQNAILKKLVWIK